MWFASFLIFLGTAKGTKRTYRSSINSFNTIFKLLDIESPFGQRKTYGQPQVDIFMALATMASMKAAVTCRVAKCAAEDEWLLNGNRGPIIDPVMWKRMYKGIQVYKGRSLAVKSAVLPVQVRKKVEYMVARKEHLSITGVSIILAELCRVLLGLRRSEFLATAERSPNRTTLLCFKNLSGKNWDLGDCTRVHNIYSRVSGLSLHDIIRLRLCYTKHQRHRVAHEVIAGPGHKLMSVVLWLQVAIRLRMSRGEVLTPESPLLVRESRGKLVPLTASFMTAMDKVYAPTLG